MTCITSQLLIYHNRPNLWHSTTYLNTSCLRSFTLSICIPILCISTKKSLSILIKHPRRNMRSIPCTVSSSKTIWYLLIKYPLTLCLTICRHYNNRIFLLSSTNLNWLCRCNYFLLFRLNHFILRQNRLRFLQKSNIISPLLCHINEDFLSWIEHLTLIREMVESNQIIKIEPIIFSKKFKCSRCFNNIRDSLFLITHNQSLTFLNRSISKPINLLKFSNWDSEFFWNFFQIISILNNIINYWILIITTINTHIIRINSNSIIFLS